MSWSLLACTALALLLMTPISTQGKPAIKTTLVGVAIHSLQQSIETLREAAAANQSEVPEAGTLALLISGSVGAWCVRRRNAAQ